MSRKTINLGNDVELTLDEPNELSYIDRPLLVTSAIVEAFSATTTLSRGTRTGFFPLKIGAKIYQVYYQIRVNRIINALTAYSEAINHIEKNPHLYDRRLARQAIAVLRDCCQERMK